jgi:thymidylate synthase (FAD)
MQATTDEAWRSQAATNRQGSGDCVPAELGRSLTQSEEQLQGLARRVYEERLEAGIAREQARKDLPLSTYTEAYWKIDLHNLLHFLALRMDTHAQLEIRRYAETIGREIVAPLFPLVWEAFLDYRVQAMRLTRLDQEVIRRLATRPAGTLPATHAEFLAAQDPSWAGLERCRERDECLAKLTTLGLIGPSATSKE